jgi:hypothetical protein
MVIAPVAAPPARRRSYDFRATQMGGALLAPGQSIMVDLPPERQEPARPFSASR